MSTNLFEPPRAAVDDAAAEDVRKPLAVWMLQIGLLPLAYLLAKALVSIGTLLVYQSQAPPPQLFVHMVIDVLLLAGMLATGLGSEFRNPRARWGGILLVAGFCALCDYFFLVVDPSEYPNAATGEIRHEVLVDRVLAAIALAVGGLLCWRFGFTAKARAWFRVSSAHRP